MEFNIIKTEGTGGTPEQLYTRNIASSKVIGKVILFDDKSFPLGAVVMPNEVVGGGHCCKNCRSYEMTRENHLQNFCSQFCIRMDKLYGWNTEKDYCNKFSRREA